MVKCRDHRLKEIRTSETHSKEVRTSKRINILSQETKILNKINEMQRDRVSKNRKQGINDLLNKLTMQKNGN